MLVDIESSSNSELRDTVTDLFLQPFFTLSRRFTQYTLVRLSFVIFLLPVYFYCQIFSALPTIIRNFVRLFSTAGRRRLRNASDVCRREERHIAEQQWHDTYQFPKAAVISGSDSAKRWKTPLVCVSVCGISVRVAHAKPVSSSPDRKQILLLHGNPSWSFIWRDIIQPLTESGHEVFAVDWLGHGASDKPTSVREISFELHMRTLLNVIEKLNLKDFYIAAHDWGGCVALCTIPHFPASHRCEGLLLLNSFLPARPSDITLHSYLLYVLWFLSTGILGPLLPESMVMRFMAPNITSTIARAYSWPYDSTPMSAKASINRFSHIVPGLPDFILNLRSTYLWRLIEGLLGPERFTNITAQARLADRDRAVRDWWFGARSSSHSHAEVISREDVSSESDLLTTVNGTTSSPQAAIPPKNVFVVFGPDDPLLPDFKCILEKSIKVTTCISPDLDYSESSASREKREEDSYQDAKTEENGEAKEKTPRSKDPKGLELREPTPVRSINYEQQEQERIVSQPYPRLSIVGSGSGSVVQNGWLMVANGTAGHYPMETKGAVEVIKGAIDVLIEICTYRSATD
ncbi:uncharacterized protein Z520_01235 [Fonsecaea multimorphosa CBS 102226]|uniref:AB hydrolase-1 domain-containing protein n=1 Tax=Fonsecaea multimorphosa CBS 102226 TaxID=1442371 RepID=A0A0D2KH15_9EURO|nr:uncharacterized protein Z520_01235 [Fonsecaea multimorphosa CBS 102226]KIY02770.1 hypothetical protein Z520_01235 [Fonsecaea multimorphosa CBS 102226]OAL31194.1 hypothetical protein AYO22_01227 [Fonsecaea multimorphosa]